MTFLVAKVSSCVDKFALTGGPVATITGLSQLRSSTEFTGCSQSTQLSYILFADRLSRQLVPLVEVVYSAQVRNVS